MKLHGWSFIHIIMSYWILSLKGKNIIGIYREQAKCAQERVNPPLKKFWYQFSQSIIYIGYQFARKGHQVPRKSARNDTMVKIESFYRTVPYEVMMGNKLKNFKGLQMHFHNRKEQGRRDIKHGMRRATKIPV